jgi:hypothetical protein
VGGFAYLLDGAAAVASADGQRIGMGLVAATLAWSGAVKLRRPAPAASALVDFGIARRARDGAGRALGAIEAGLAAALIVGLAVGGAAATAAAAAAALLFATFTVLIARSLRDGASFECACFGSGTPLSSITLVRAGLLAALGAVLAVTAGPATATADIASATVAGTAVVALVALAGTLSPLLRWNDDPFALDDRLVESWEDA